MMIREDEMEDLDYKNSLKVRIDLIEERIKDRKLKKLITNLIFEQEDRFVNNSKFIVILGSILDKPLTEVIFFNRGNTHIRAFFNDWNDYISVNCKSDSPNINFAVRMGVSNRIKDFYKKNTSVLAVHHHDCIAARVIKCLN